MKCQVAYEVSRGNRSVVFTSRKIARKFARREDGVLRVVKLCSGKIAARGKPFYPRFAKEN